MLGGNWTVLPSSCGYKKVWAVGLVKFEVRAGETEDREMGSYSSSSSSSTADLNHFFKGANWLLQQLPSRNAIDSQVKQPQVLGGPPSLETSMGFRLLPRILHVLHVLKPYEGCQALGWLSRPS